MKQLSEGDRTLLILVMMFTLASICLILVIDDYKTLEVVQYDNKSNLDCSNNLTYSYYNYTTGEVTYNTSKHKVCNEVIEID